MPDLIIDGRAVTVPAGTPVIEAAQRLGIMIPRFCWHKALKVAGACRMCAVYFLDGPVKGLEMSCSTLALDGMVVDTGHPEAVDFRRWVIELLMVNHPHDCPVCDEGGQCLLQDETISGNHALRRYPGRKRTYRDQDLGPFVAHEMNRCIHCYRCSRFYQDIAGGRDFGPMQIASRVYFGRYEDGRLESPFSGNIVDLCPTGVLTDKTARFKARHWDLERAPSVCPHCSLGCNTTVNARYREVVRIEARANAAVNGYFLCDRGRFSHGFSSLPDRPRKALSRGLETSMEQAVTQLCARLKETAARHGPQALACLSSSRASLETLGALAGLAQSSGWTGPAVFSGPAQAGRTLQATLALSDTRACSLAEVAQADAVLCLGVDPVNEAPMLALALRQAALRGAPVLTADPRPLELPLPFVHLPVHPRDLPACLDALIALAAPAAENAPDALARLLPGYPELWPRLEQAAPALAACRRPLLVWGQAMPGPGLGEAVVRAAEVLSRTKDDCKLMAVLPGPNAYGAALLDKGDRPTWRDVLAGVSAGRIKAVLAVECDLPDPEILGGLEMLAVLDHLPSPIADMAQIFLPTTNLYESGASLVNNEGRLQFARPVQARGLPVSQDGRGGHPPRLYDLGLPGSDPKPAWEILADLQAALGGRGPSHPWEAVAAACPALAHLAPENYPFDGVRVVRHAAAPGLSPGAEAEARDTGPGTGFFSVVRGESLFGSDALGSYSPLARRAAGEPVARLASADALALGLADSDTAVITLDGRSLEIGVRPSPHMPPGVLVLPGHLVLESGTARVGRKKGEGA